MRYSYPCRIERDGDGWVASFPDVPEALTGGSDYEQTVELAADALITALSRSYVARRRELPLPGARAPGEILIPVPALVTRKDQAAAAPSDAPLDGMAPASGERGIEGGAEPPERLGDAGSSLNASGGFSSHRRASSPNRRRRSC